MRVVHVGNYKPESPNGVNQVIAGLVDALLEQKIEMELWNFTPKVNRISHRFINGIHIFDIPCHSSRILNLLHLPKTSWSFIRDRARIVDVIHMHSVFVPCNIWCSRLGIPYIVTPHGGYNPQILNGRLKLLKKLWFCLFERPYLNRASRIQALTPREQRELRALGIETATVVVPNGVSRRQRYDIGNQPRDPNAWLFLGRLGVYKKGLDNLLNGYSILVRESRRSVPPLFIVGPSHNDGETKIKELIARLGLSEYVHVRGPVVGVDKWRMIQNCSLFIHTSRSEGLPIAILEAMSLGKPVLITPETNLDDHIRDRDCGWVVNGTPEGIACGLKEVLNTPSELLQAKGFRAEKLINETFSWDFVAESMTAVYEGMIR